MTLHHGKTECVILQHRYDDQTNDIRLAVTDFLLSDVAASPSIVVVVTSSGISVETIICVICVKNGASETTL
ncbi:hypothetical protein A2U01_0014514 [Trifolium medium]|uniref:Uncharacterized protein n=1 Tax=Trifolium medium TaxID=97028 RepID=A0A392N1W6_9FABA|nr:hypothetical protein [Trifolium medium]